MAARAWVKGVKKRVARIAPRNLLEGRLDGGEVVIGRNLQ